MADQRELYRVRDKEAKNNESENNKKTVIFDLREVFRFFFYFSFYRLFIWALQTLDCVNWAIESRDAAESNRRKRTEGI